MGWLRSSCLISVVAKAAKFSQIRHDRHLHAIHNIHEHPANIHTGKIPGTRMNANVRAFEPEHPHLQENKEQDIDEEHLPR